MRLAHTYAYTHTRKLELTEATATNSREKSTISVNKLNATVNFAAFDTPRCTLFFAVLQTTNKKWFMLFDDAAAVVIVFIFVCRFGLGIMGNKKLPKS